jgi:hypothetical protein
MGLAWEKATNSPGSWADADVWILFQTSAMQVLGLFTAIFPIYNASAASVSRWTWIFTALGMACAIGTILMYLLVATIWGFLISFLVSVAQAYAVLQLALHVSGQHRK